MSETKNAVAVRESSVLPIPVNNMADIVSVGELVAKSQMFGEITAPVGTMIALTMYQEKISPLDFTRRYHVIDGKVTKRADATLAEFAMRGGKYKIIQADDKCVEIDFSNNGNSIKGKMSIEDAKAKGIAIAKGGNLKTNWQRFPQQMLFARVVTNAVRMVMPEIVCGIYSPEEVTEFNDDNQKAIESRPLKTINAETVKRRIANVKAEDAEVVPTEPQTPAANDSVDVDYDVCPVKKGNLFGVKWMDMSADILACAIKLNPAEYPEMTDEHKRHAKYALDRINEQAMEAMGTED